MHLRKFFRILAMEKRVHHQLADCLRNVALGGYSSPAALTTCSSANEPSVHRLLRESARPIPQDFHLDVMPTSTDKPVAGFECRQSIFVGAVQSPMVGLCGDPDFKTNKQELHKNYDDCEINSHAAICGSENRISAKQQACNASEEVFLHKNSDGDFYEDIKISDEAGEPLMPRSLLDQEVETLMHEENDQGHLLWQRFKKAAAIRNGFTCESVLNTWVGEGKVASRPVVMYCVLAFRSWKKNKRALELLNLVLTKKRFEVVEIDHAIYIDLLCKAGGFKKAVKYYKQILKTPPNSMMCSIFIAAYLEHGMEEDAKKHLLQARSLGYPELTFLFNQFLLFYKAKGRMRDVADLLKEMESLGVDANLNTYNIILDVRARKGDISGMQSLWKYLEDNMNMRPDAASYALLAKGYMNAGLFDRAATAVKKLEISPYPDKPAVYRWLLKLYAHLKREDRLERVWDRLKPLSKSLVDDYSIMVDSLGKAGKVDRAEEIFKEGLNAFGIKRLHQYHTIITVFLKHEMIQKADDLVDELTKHAFNPGSSTYHQLIEVYAKRGDENKAMETLRKAQDASKVFAGQKPWHASYVIILEMFGNKGDVEQAELVVKEFKGTGYFCSFKMYSALLKAYVKAKTMPDGFLDRMRADGVIPNSHIRKELEKLMDNRRELYEVCGAKRYLY